MKHKAIVLAVIAATMHARAAHGATALEYSVHAQLPRGESMSGTVRVGDRARGPLVDALNASNAVAEAGTAGKNTVQIALGPEHTCINLSVRRSGDTVTATGTAKFPPPPPRERNRENGAQQPPPPPPNNGPGRDADATVRIIVTLDHQRLARANGDVAPARDARGPHLAWTLEKVAQ